MPSDGGNGGCPAESVWSVRQLQARLDDGQDERAQHRPKQSNEVFNRSRMVSVVGNDSDSLPGEPGPQEHSGAHVIYLSPPSTTTDSSPSSSSSSSDVPSSVFGIVVLAVTSASSSSSWGRVAGRERH